MIPVRVCVACRQKKPQKELIRLTCEAETGRVFLNTGKQKINGRSSYLCRSQACVTQALKGTRLKAALEGRKVKGKPNTRSVRYPLESQIIQLIYSQCTEAEKTCQNTHSKE